MRQQLTLFADAFAGPLFAAPSRHAAPVSQFARAPAPPRASAPVAPAAPQPRADPALAAKLRTIADALQSFIDNKLGDRLANTPKRQRQAGEARLEGLQAERAQKALRALADHHDAGTAPAVLASVKTKAEAMELARAEIDRSRCGYYDYGIDTCKPYARDRHDERAAFWALLTHDPAHAAADALQRKIEALQFAKIAGYFPTPAAIVARMIDEADLDDATTILEPSAGSGAILDAVRSAHPAAQLTAYEVHHSLRDILTAKGYTLAGHDFLTDHDGTRFDRVLMNPPFENGQDMAHVRAAFDTLHAGGRLVAIMAPSAFFNQSRKAQEFRDWFDDLAGDRHDIPAGAFKESGTGVATVLVVIDKPIDHGQPSPDDDDTDDESADDYDDDEADVIAWDAEQDGDEEQGSAAALPASPAPVKPPADPLVAQILAHGLAPNEFVLSINHTLCADRDRSTWPWPYNLPSRLFEFPVEFQPATTKAPARVGMMHPLLGDHPHVRRVEAALGLALDPNGAPNDYGVSGQDKALWWHAVDLIASGHWRDLLQTLQFTTTDCVVNGVAYGLDYGPHEKSRKGGAHLSTQDAREILKAIGADMPADPSPEDALRVVQFGECTQDNGRKTRTVNWMLGPGQLANVWGRILGIERGWLKTTASGFLEGTDTGKARTAVLI